MRITPLDSLNPTPDELFEPIPRPKFPIGTRLDPRKLSDLNRAYYLKQIRNGLIRQLRQTVTSLRKKGYLAEMTSKKLLPLHKQRLRDMFNFMATADFVEVAGHRPHGMHISNQIAHQCYVTGGTGWSGLSFDYYVLFRKVGPANKQLAFLCADVTFSESEVKNCRIG